MGIVVLAVLYSSITMNQFRYSNMARVVCEFVDEGGDILCAGQLIYFCAFTLGIVVEILNHTAPAPSQLFTSLPDGTFAR